MSSIVNNGLDLEREVREQDGTELKVGAITAFLFKAPETERRKYQPIGEVQMSNRADMMDCATRDKVNILEEDLNFAYRNGLLLPETKQWLEDNDFVVTVSGMSYVQISDAFTAIKSGTTKSGNSLKAPAQALHEWGFVPKKWMPLEEWMAFEDYHNPTRITPKIAALAKESVQRLPINYQQVQNWQFSQELHRGSLSTAGHAWDDPVNGIYQRSSGNFNHAFKLFENEFFAFDNYHDVVDGDYIKQLAPDFRFFDWGYQIGFTGQNTVIALPPISFQDRVDALNASIAELLAKISALWATMPTPAPVPTPKPPPPPIIPRSKIQAWALAIQHEEGGKPNDPNTRNRNPGNLKYTPYTASLGGKKGPAGSDGGSFCVFDTYDQGFKALCQFLTDAANNQLIPYHDPQYRTLKGFTQHYANPPANHPYAQNVARALGVPVNIQIKSLLTGISSVDNQVASKLSANIITRMDAQIVSAIVIVLITLARAFGFDLDTGMATEIVSALGVLVAAATVWYQRTTLQKAPSGIGDVNFVGQAK